MPELPEVAALTDFLDEQLRGAVVHEGPDRLLRGAQDGGSAVLRRCEGRAVTGVRRFGKFVSMDADGLSFRLPPGTGRLGPLHRRPHRHPAENGQGPHRGPAVLFRRVRPARHGPDGGGHEKEPGGLCGPGSARRSRASRRSDRTRSVRGSTSIPWRRFSGSSSQQIKGLLRSQSVIAGIGNAYSDEILHAARISPFAIAKSLDREAVQLLYDAIHSILGTALKEAGGKAAE